MNLFIKKKQETHTTIYKIGKQQGLAVQHREFNLL